MQNVKTNKQFMVLSVIGIFIVVACHLAGEIYRFFKVFPYIAIFIFISGYFYKEEKEDNVFSYIFYKFKKLMIPFFIINLIYGIIVNIFKSAGIINFGEEVNLFTLFVQPFINNNQFVFNFPAWFVPTLFLTYVFYVNIHKVYRKIKFNNEVVLLIFFIILQVVSVYYQKLTSQYTYIISLFRIMFFLPFFQFGYIYKQKWQKYDDKIPTIPYLIILFTINYIAYKKFGDLNYDMHEFSGFKSNILILPTITSFIGILFYTRIARVLSKWIGESKIINYISNSTFSIMTHHVFVSFLVGAILYGINKNITSIPYFNIDKFKAGWVYIYEIPGKEIITQIGYLILGIGVSLLIHYVYNKIKEKAEKIDLIKKNSLGKEY